VSNPIKIRLFSRAILLVALLPACKSSKGPVDVSDPNHPGTTIEVQKDVADLCGLMCEKLVESYGVPGEQQERCVFECATGFNEEPQACYELVACIQNGQLCLPDGDVSDACAASAGPCFDHWSLANGRCRGCWEPSSTVTGERRFVHRSDSSEEISAEPLATTTVAAHFPVGEGWRTIKGRGASDGTFSIPGVPGCGYWLQIGKSWEWTSERRPDRTFVMLGRKDVRQISAQQPTLLDLDLTNLLPWTERSGLELFIPGIGYWAMWGWPWGERIEPWPQIGSTSLRLTVDYAFFSSALPEASKGDRAYVLQYAPERGPDWLLHTAQRFLVLDRFGLNEGETNPVTGAFEDAPDRRTARLNLDRDAFEALRSGLNPTNRPSEENVGILIHTFPSDELTNYLGVTADLLVLTASVGQGAIDLGERPYFTAFPTSWPVRIDASLSVPRVYGTGIDGAEPAVFRQTITVSGPVSIANGDPLRPVIGPVTELQIDGSPALAERVTISPRPTITWSNPSLGQPTAIAIQVYQLVPGEQPLRIARFRTTERRMRLPPGLLVRGELYFFVIEAILESPGGRSGSASIVTGELSPLAVEPTPAPAADAGVVSEREDAAVPQDGVPDGSGPVGAPDGGAASQPTCQGGCSAGAEGGCSCRQTCDDGSSIDMDCNGVTCFCGENGMTTSSFDQGGWCAVDTAQKAFMRFCGAQ
jgi:hypothetical protein